MIRRISQKLRDGMVMGLGICLTVGAVSGVYATYATLTASPSETLTKDKWNEMLQYTVPPGAVMAFNLTSCPTGWSAADGGGSPARPDLRGEFIRGLDSGRGVDSWRALASWQRGSALPTPWKTETRLVQITSNSSDWAAAANDLWIDFDTNWQTAWNTSTVNAIQYSIGTSTWAISSFEHWHSRPRNVALLYCVKN